MACHAIAIQTRTIPDASQELVKVFFKHKVYQGLRKNHGKISEMTISGHF